MLIYKYTLQGGLNMSALINKMLNLVGFDPEPDDEPLTEEEGYNSNTSATASQENTRGNYNPFRKNSKVVNLTDSNQLKLVVMQPSSFEDAPDICTHLKEKKPVVVNLEYVDKDTARRLIDFFSGAVYGVDGHIEKVSASIFLLVPYNVDILNTTREDINKGAFPWIK